LAARPSRYRYKHTQTRSTQSAQALRLSLTLTPHSRIGGPLPLLRFDDSLSPQAVVLQTILQACSPRAPLWPFPVDQHLQTSHTTRRASARTVGGRALGSWTTAEVVPTAVVVADRRPRQWQMAVLWDSRLVVMAHNGPRRVPLRAPRCACAAPEPGSAAPRGSPVASRAADEAYHLWPTNWAPRRLQCARAKRRAGSESRCACVVTGSNGVLFARPRTRPSRMPPPRRHP